MSGQASTLRMLTDADERNRKRGYCGYLPSTYLSSVAYYRWMHGDVNVNINSKNANNSKLVVALLAEFDNTDERLVPEFLVVR